MKKIIILMLAAALPLLCAAQAKQSKRPRVGMQIPDFTLTHITHYDKKQASAKDFSGKWLILDFWGTTCASCIASFPKLNELQAAFKDSAQFVLIGVSAVALSGKNIEALYENLREKRKLQLASAYDSILYRKWGVSSYPHMVIIDPQGVVRYITGGSDLTKEKMRDIISGQTVALRKKDAGEPEFDAYFLSDIKENIFSQSVLTRNNGEHHRIHIMLDECLKAVDYFGNVALAGISLEHLYSFAYNGYVSAYITNVSDSLYGKVANKVIVEVKDPSLFHTDYQQTVPVGTYNYALTLPKGSYERNNVMRIMQEDLKRSFGYQAVFETRKVPTIQLIAKKGAAAKLATKGGAYKFSPIQERGGSSEGTLLTTFHGGFSAQNMKVDQFMGLLNFYMKISDAQFFNATDIKTNIDITLAADMTDLQDIRKELQQQGLDLVVVERPMKVLVIKDPH